MSNETPRRKRSSQQTHPNPKLVHTCNEPKPLKQHLRSTHRNLISIQKFKSKLQFGRKARVRFKNTNCFSKIPACWISLHPYARKSFSNSPSIPSFREGVSVIWARDASGYRILDAIRHVAELADFLLRDLPTLNPNPLQSCFSSRPSLFSLFDSSCACAKIGK
jgi:hypothetical protein